MSTKGAARHGRDSALSVSAWPLRRKVALALAIPLLLAATLGGLRVRSDLVEASNSSTSARQVTVLEPAVDYLVAAEQAMVAAQNDDRDSAGDLAAAVTDIKAAADELAETRDTADLDAEQRYQVDVVLDLSRALREGSADTLSPGTWVAQLRQLQSGVTQLITTIVNAQIEPEPRLELLAQTLAGRFSLAMQQALASNERPGPAAQVELYSEIGAEGVAIDRLANAIGDTEPAIATLRTDNAERFRTARTGGTDLGDDSAYEEYDALIGDLQAGIDQELKASATDARNRAIVNAAATLGLLLAAVLLALLISRMILAPIQRVREGTRSVAHERLPAAVARIRAGEDPGRITPIDVHTEEEIGQLARAVDDMHQQAVVLAAGEAKLRSQVSDMFVTLSRRNTTLVNQQLSLIESLEKDEEDPRRLRSLFRLDHLAARMRRTADSLLILADAPSPATAGERLTVGDAMQAATAGVQDYQRVRIRSTNDVALSDSAASDVVHLLTELIDNALAFSPPDTEVSLEAVATSEGVVLEVADRGLGIPADDLETINESLRSGGEVTPDTARRMGLFVVSRLARRHGITCQLQSNPGGGTTARVVLPPSVLPSSAPAGVPASTPPAPAAQPRQARPDVAREAAPADDVAERINRSIGLPVRRPGTAIQGTPLQQPTTSTPEPDRTAPAMPERTAARAPEPPRPAPATPGPVWSDGRGPGLDGEWVDPGDARDADTPIFTAMRSAWLSSGANAQPWRSSEVEEGWSRADRVAETPAERVLSSTGLPVRRPGARLLPGGVEKPTTPVARDPEAVKARLAAHAAGVSRGRRAASRNPDPEHTEADPS